MTTIENATPEELLIRAIPALRNPRYRDIYETARFQRLALAQAGSDCDLPPVYSYNATYQSMFEKGWRSVTAQDIRLNNALNTSISQAAALCGEN